MAVYLRWLLVAGLYLGCAQFAFLAFVQEPGNPDTFEKARLTDMVDGTAHRPFVYRTLLPSTVRLIRACSPSSAWSALGRFAERWSPCRKLFSLTPAAEQTAPATYLVAYALEFAALLAFAFTLRAAIVHFHGPASWLPDLLPALAVASLPALYCYISYDYDFPQLFLFTLGFLLLAQRRWRWFYPVLVLGALSKETTILLVLVHVLGHMGRMPRRRLVAHAVAQLVVLVFVRSVLQFIVFRDNPGPALEVWFSRNWELIADPTNWRYLFFDVVWFRDSILVVPTRYNIPFLILLVPYICWKWSAQPVLLRRSLWIAPVLVVLTFLFGYFDEMRSYYEVFVVVFLLCAGTVCRLAGSEVAGSRRPTTG